MTDAAHTSSTRLDGDDLANFERTMKALAGALKKTSERGILFQPKVNNAESTSEFSFAFKFLKDFEYDLDGQKRGFSFNSNLGLSLKRTRYRGA